MKLLTQESHPVFRPPNREVEPLLSLSKSLKAIAEKEANHPVVILGGDFNLPHISWENGCGQVNSSPNYGLLVSNTLLDMVNDFHLKQLVHESTCDTDCNHTLDLVSS